MRMLSTWARGGAGASQVGVPSLGGRASSPTYAHAGHAGSRDVKAAPNGDRVANGRACAGAEGDGAAQLGGLFLAQLPHRPHTLLRAATGTDCVRARVGRARGDVAGAGAERGRGACLGPLVKHNATLAALELNVLDAVRERNADHDPVHLRRRGEAGVCVRADRAEPSGQAGRHFRGCPSCDNPITPPLSLSPPPPGGGDVRRTLRLAGHALLASLHGQGVHGLGPHHHAHAVRSRLRARPHNLGLAVEGHVRVLPHGNLVGHELGGWRVSGTCLALGFVFLALAGPVRSTHLELAVRGHH